MELKEAEPREQWKARTTEADRTELVAEEEQRKKSLPRGEASIEFLVSSREKNEISLTTRFVQKKSSQ